MSIEQQDNDSRYEKKSRDLEKKKKEEFWLEKEIYRESSELINTLAKEIAEKFGIEINEAKNLISWEVSHDLHSLKWSLSQSINTVQLWEAINSAKTKIEDLSKKHREKLKKSLEATDYSPNTHEYKSSRKLLWDALIQRAKEPTGITDQLIWIWIWCIDSAEAVIIYSYELGKWILLSPYHLYLLLSQKWECPDFKNI